MQVPLNCLSIRGIAPRARKGLPRVGITQHGKGEGDHFRARETTAKLVTEPVSCFLPGSTLYHHMGGDIAGCLIAIIGNLFSDDCNVHDVSSPHCIPRSNKM